MKRQQYGSIGSISHGTMRPEDLIPCFLSEADSIKMTKADRNKVRSLAKEWDENGAGDFSDEMLDELFDVLGNYAPPYFYFGAHPGDGADYGFWLSEEWRESFDGIIESSNGFKTTYTQDREEIDGVPKGYTGELMSINDHDNMTLYVVSRGRKREVWSIV